MSNDQNSSSGLSLDSYSLEDGPNAVGESSSAPSAKLAARAVVAEEHTADAPDPAPALPIRIVLRGQGFLIGALDPIIMIGNVRLRDYEISSDSRTISGYLHELPAEGSVISIDYGRAGRAELPERFSLSKFTGDVA